MRFPTSIWIAILGLMLVPTTMFAQTPYSRVIQHLSIQTHRTWQRAAAADVAAVLANPGVTIRHNGGSKVKAAAKKRALNTYLVKLVPAMKPEQDVAHIPAEHPVPVQTDPQKNWTRYYTKAKTKLRPNVKYEWSSNAARSKMEVMLTQAHVDTLRANFDVLMWYRNELDEEGSGGNLEGAKNFKHFLDYTVAGILDGMPSAPQVELNRGFVSVAKWELDEKTLRDQLVMAYRYLVAKYQIYPQYVEFAPADKALLSSLIKIAYLTGAQMNFESFETMDVKLQRKGHNNAWKRPIVKALSVLNESADEVNRAEADQYAAFSQGEQPCVITIPPPKPKAKPKPPAPAPPRVEQKIEIILKHK